MPRQLALLLLAAAIVTVAGCPAQKATGVDETTTSGGKPSGSKSTGPGSKPTAKPSPATTTYPATPSPKPTATTGGGTGTPTGTPSGGTGTGGTPAPSATPGGGGTTAPTGTGSATPSPSGSAAVEPAPKFATVNIEATGFKPTVITVQRTGSVTFTNKDTGAIHSVVPDGSSQFTGTGDLAKREATATDGQSAGIRFDELGEYPYKCGIHPTETGRVKVVAEQK